MLKKFLCFLNFNHEMNIVSFEDGKGSEYRIKHSCRCGKKQHISDWTDDNQQLGHGTGLDN